MDGDESFLLSPGDPRIGVAEENVVILEEWLSNLEQLSPASNESWLIISLLKSARRAYQHLRNGWQCDSTYTAWACRNLLELRIFAKYIAVSPENLKRFVCDLIVDSEEKSVALKKLALRFSPELSLDYDDPNPEIHRSMRDKLSFQGSNYLSAMHLASQLGLEEDFNFMYKMCSKLVHPTAQSVLSIDSEDQNERDVHLLYGCNYLTDLVNDVIPMAQALAVRPSSRL
jgi:hypothetical protein